MREEDYDELYEVEDFCISKSDYSQLIEESKVLTDSLPDDIEEQEITK